MMPRQRADTPAVKMSPWVPVWAALAFVVAWTWGKLNGHWE